MKVIVATAAMLLIFLNLLITTFSVQLVHSLEPPVVEWSRIYGGPSMEEEPCIAETDDGGYIMAGGTFSFGAGDFDVWLVKTDACGNMLWNRTYGGTSYDIASAVVQTNDGGYMLACSTASFGAGDSDS
jgi:hypothetical protein